MLHRLLLCVAALLAAALPTASAQTPSPGLRPIASLLRADGTLDAAAHRGGVDVRGYRMTTTPTGAPRFVPVSEGAPAAADGYWDDRFGFPGVGFSEVHALLAHEGELYAAGWFTEVAGLPMTNIARWDGRRWHPLGTGMDATVHALAWYDGALYAGGTMERAGDALANGIARWDGTAWRAVGDGLVGAYGDPAVHALAVFDGALYAGGEFAEASGVPAVGLARWDGAAWHAAGDVLRGDFGDAGTVHALVADDRALYVGGFFTSVGGVAAEAVAAWDGGAWRALAGGALEDGGVPQVRALALRGDVLYVGGTFERAGGRNARNVAAWDRAAGAWSPLGAGMRGEFDAGEVRALLALDGALYAAGDFAFAGGVAANHVARWDGTSWAPLSVGAGQGVDVPASALARGPDGSLFVGGAFEYAAGLYVGRAARWDGTHFYALGEGVHTGTTFPATVYAVATSADGKVYVAGQFHFAGSAAAENVAMWDGTAWHPLGAGTDGIVHALATRGDDVFVGGRFTSAGGVAANHVARWNAATRTWHALGSGANGDVWGLAADDDWIYAVGDFTAAGSVAAEDMARWNGTSWSTLGAGIHFNPNGYVYAILLDGDFVWVGGDFQSVRTAPGEYAVVNSLLVWRASTDEWFDVAGGVTRRASGDVWGRVYALARVGGSVFVGGEFDKAGGVGANAVARFDGTAWAPLGASVGGETLQEVRAFATSGADLFVGGGFRSAGDATSRAAARWDTAAETWSGLAGGLGGADYVRVHALARHGDRLFAAGIFLSSGEAPASSVASWHLGSTPPERAALRVDRSRVDFPEVAVGSAAEVALTLTNTSATATLTGTVGVLAAPFAVASGGGAFRLAPGASHAVSVRFAPAAAGTFGGALRIDHDGGNVASPVTVALAGSARAAAQEITMRPFDPQGVQYTVRAGQDHTTQGFVFGTNAYGDRAKALAFVLPDGVAGAHISGVRAWFAYRRADAGARTYTVHVYDGTSETGPVGAPRHSQTYRLGDVAADTSFETASDPTAHAFDAPVPVGASFFVVFDFGAYPAGDAATVALASTDETGRRVAEVWEQWPDGRWANVSDAWTGAEGAPGTGVTGWYPWIEATLRTGLATDRDDAGELPEALVLEANYPNPFSAATTVSYRLPAAAHVDAAVFDVLGRRVAQLEDGPRPAGAHAVRFEAGGLPSGTYVVRVVAGGAVRSQTVVLLR